MPFPGLWYGGRFDRILMVRQQRFRDCSLFIVQGETEEKLYSNNIFSLPPLKPIKFSKPPPLTGKTRT
jgi:hypothetical protein